MPKLFKAELAGLICSFYKAVIARKIIGIETRDLAPHGGCVAAVIEMRAIIKTYSVKRLDRFQRDVI